MLNSSISDENKEYNILKYVILPFYKFLDLTSIVLPDDIQNIEKFCQYLTTTTYDYHQNNLKIRFFILPISYQIEWLTLLNMNKASLNKIIVKTFIEIIYDHNLSLLSNETMIILLKSIKLFVISNQTTTPMYIKQEEAEQEEAEQEEAEQEEVEAVKISSTLVHELTRKKYHVTYLTLKKVDILTSSLNEKIQIYQNIYQYYPITTTITDINKISKIYHLFINDHISTNNASLFLKHCILLQLQAYTLSISSHLFQHLYQICQLFTTPFTELILTILLQQNIHLDLVNNCLPLLTNDLKIKLLLLPLPLHHIPILKLISLKLLKTSQFTSSIQLTTFLNYFLSNDQPTTKATNKQLVYSNCLLYLLKTYPKDWWYTMKDQIVDKQNQFHPMLLQMILKQLKKA